MTSAALTPEFVDWHSLYVYKDGKLYDKTTLKECGHISTNGYVRTFVNIEGFNRLVRVHRIIYEMFHGRILDKSLGVDHIDGNRQNNLIENLRLATYTQNSANRGCVKGYSKKRDKFSVEIWVGRSKIWIGVYDTELEARIAYIRAKIEHHKDFVPKEMLEELESYEKAKG